METGDDVKPDDEKESIYDELEKWDIPLRAI